MGKKRTLEQIEAEMLKLREKKVTLYEQRRVLAAERRELIVDSQNTAQGGVTVQPEPAILTAKTEQ